MPYASCLIDSQPSDFDDGEWSGSPPITSMRSRSTWESHTQSVESYHTPFLYFTTWGNRLKVTERGMGQESLLLKVVQG
jgi:hypothetical protein